MAKKILDAENIGEISEGYVGAAIDATLRKIYDDITDRGADGLPRSLKLELSFKLVSFKLVGKDQLEITSKIDAKIPAHKPVRTIAKLNAPAGGFTFSPETAHSPDQKTFADTLDKE